MDSDTVDPGPKGFLGIFGESADTEAAAEPDRDDAAQDVTTAADTETPEPSAEDLSADDVVAARLAASLEADGIDVPTPEEPAETSPAETGDAAHALLGEPSGELSLDDMTPEQLRALAEEAIKLRGEVSTTTQQESLRKVQAAEIAAITEVQTDWERAMARSEAHYDAYLNGELDKIEDASEKQNEVDPRAYRRQHGAHIRREVDKARRDWEAKLLDDAEQLAQDARLNARLTSPEFRQYAAEHLVQQAGLPDAAVAEVLKTTDTRQFEARVQELVAIRDALLAERNRNQAQLRVEGNKRLRETTPRTTPTGRPRGGKPPPYKGTAAEGARILSLIHTRR